MTRTLRLGWPNRITIGRMLLVGPFVVCLLNQDAPGGGWMRWAAVGIFAAMAVSDMLDGFLARRLNQVSRLGSFLDPLADKLLVTCAVLILCVVGVSSPDAAPASEKSLRLPNWVAVAAVGKDLIVSLGFLVILILTRKPYIQPRLLGKLCTTVQLLLVLAMLVWLDMPGWLLWLPEALWIVATILAAAAALDYVRLGTRHLARFAAAEEQPPLGE